MCGENRFSDRNVRNLNKIFFIWYLYLGSTKFDFALKNPIWKIKTLPNNNNFILARMKNICHSTTTLVGEHGRCFLKNRE